MVILIAPPPGTLVGEDLIPRVQTNADIIEAVLNNQWHRLQQKCSNQRDSRMLLPSLFFVQFEQQPELEVLEEISHTREFGGSLQSSPNILVGSPPAFSLLLHLCCPPC